MHPGLQLHVHIEGCLTPQRCYEIVTRNGLDPKEFDPDQATKRRQCGSWLHGDYQPLMFCGPNEMAINAFLTEYTRCNATLRTELDFYELMMDYLERAAENGVVRAEIFFDPQMHCFEDNSGAGAAAIEMMGGPPRDPKGIGKPRTPYETVLGGLTRGLKDGKEKFGVDGALILSFLQDRSFEEAMEMLNQAIKPENIDKIIGVGMDNGTGPWGPMMGGVPNSTARFAPIYEKAKAAGLMLTAHAGEEEGASCVEMCMEVLKVDRIDHGVRCMEDPAVVAKLKAKQTPCTVCPISNHRAQVGASQAASRWLSTRLDYDTYSY
jgi:adenosine deaminase